MGGEYAYMISCFDYIAVLCLHFLGAVLRGLHPVAPLEGGQQLLIGNVWVGEPTCVAEGDSHLLDTLRPRNLNLWVA